MCATRRHSFCDYIKQSVKVRASFGPRIHGRNAMSPQYFGHYYLAKFPYECNVRENSTNIPTILNKGEATSNRMQLSVVAAARNMNKVAPAINVP